MKNTETQFQPIADKTADAINAACIVVHDWARKKGWWDNGERNKGELIALMHSELSEALEALRHGNPPDDKCPDLPGDAAEMADTVIRILDYCGAYGIALGDVIRRKHEFNITRPHKHGKSF